NPGEDSRTWIGRQHEKIIPDKPPFSKNMALWLLGIHSFRRNGSFIPFKTAGDPVTFSREFDDIPFAWVNCKKESGGNTVLNDALLCYVQTYGRHLRKQIEILSPKIVICCGGSGTVLQIAKTTVFPNVNFTRI